MHLGESPQNLPLVDALALDDLAISASGRLMYSGWTPAGLVVSPRRARAAGARPLILGGPDEKELGAQLRQAMKGKGAIGLPDEVVPLDRLAISPRLRDALARLGVTTVGEFVRLPGGGILKRFGKAAYQLHILAAGERWDPLKPAPPPDPAIDLRVVDLAPDRGCCRPREAQGSRRYRAAVAGVTFVAC